MEWSQRVQIFTGFRAFLDYLYHMALPIIVCLTGIGGLIRYVRGALLDALSMDYVRTARAKGLKEKLLFINMRSVTR